MAVSVALAKKRGRKALKRKQIKKALRNNGIFGTPKHLRKKVVEE
jgi:hypothetical protein